jgi:hypothetical protein
MKFSIQKLDKKIGMTEVAIANSRRNSYIMERIKPYQYDENRLKEGTDLVNLIKNLTLRFLAAQTARRLATKELRETWNLAKVRYSQSRKVARLVFRNQAPQKRALALDRASARALPQWLEEARQFYTNALADPDIPNKLSYFGLTVERLKEEQQLLENVEKAMANQEKKAAEAMQVTKERKQAIKELDRWMVDFFAILRLALGKSQHLEAVGIVVK